ncbi:hypothetical protein ISO30_12385 [Staphylococcus saprophyticus]|nr:hypothetical protein [Staphylococcus saprophyticus]MBF2782496.1 hypothetical protein [Staphylococcus saprophyticus]
MAKLPNPWVKGAKWGLQIGASQCKNHTKYTCKTSPAETKNAAGNINKQ